MTDRTKLSDIFLYAVLIVLCTVVFCAIFGHHVLNPVNTDWLLSGIDLPQHYLGWKAFRSEP